MVNAKKNKKSFQDFHFISWCLGSMKPLWLIFFLNSYFLLHYLFAISSSYAFCCILFTACFKKLVKSKFGHIIFIYPSKKKKSKLGHELLFYHLLILYLIKIELLRIFRSMFTWDISTWYYVTYILLTKNSSGLVLLWKPYCPNLRWGARLAIIPYFSFSLSSLCPWLWKLYCLHLRWGMGPNTVLFLSFSPTFPLILW